MRNWLRNQCTHFSNEFHRQVKVYFAKLYPWPECESILNFFEEGPATPTFFESHLK